MSHISDKQRSNKDPLISIIMPCYNAEAYIDEAILSVLEQTEKNWELIVINDGSKDQSRHVVERFTTSDSRIRLIENEQNMGVSKTRNRGIEISKGRWIAFLDSDDVWEGNKLEKQMRLNKEKNAQFIFTGCNVIDENSKVIGKMSNIPLMVTYPQLQRWNMITCSSVLISREALGDLRFEKDYSREDYLLWLKVLYNLQTAYALDESLVQYRITENSRSSNKIKMIRDTYRVHRFLGTGRVISILYTLSHFITAYRRKYRSIIVSKS